MSDETVEVDKDVYDDAIAMLKSAETVLSSATAYNKADKVQRCRERLEAEE